MSRIPRIFVDHALASGAEIRADDRAHRHLIKVLRLRDGAPLKVFDGRGHEHAATLIVRADATILRLAEPLEVIPEPGLRICLVQGISRGERMDLVIQKATELGVAEVRPVTTQRSVVRLDDRRSRRRLQHWRAVAVAACEQCGRATLPSIYPPAEYESALDGLPSGGTRLMLDASADTAPARPADGGLILLVGPEGGLSDVEKQTALGRRFQPLAVGPRIMRTETAALAAVAIVQYLWGDLRVDA